MKIAGIKLKSRAVMAPMAGITDSAFRSIVFEFGAGLATSELLSANAIVRGSEKTIRMLPLPGEPGPVAAQIFGPDPETMREAAVIVSQSPCALIDINFGCPVKKVTKCGAGAAALKDITTAGRIAAAVVDSTDKPVTAKIRSGWGAESVNAVEMAKTMEDAGVSAITIHARTAAQGYSGEADWRLISEVARRVNIPVIGNGDINSPETAVDRLESTGCDFVMIGRAALGAPWIFRQFNELRSTGSYGKISNSEIAAVIFRQMEMMTALYGQRNAARKMRTRLGYYTRGLAGAARFRKAATKLESAHELEELVTGLLLKKQVSAIHGGMDR